MACRKTSVLALRTKSLDILFGAKSWSYNIISLLFDVLVHLLPLLNLSPCVPSYLSFLSFIQVYKS